MTYVCHPSSIVLSDDECCSIGFDSKLEDSMGICKHEGRTRNLRIHFESKKMFLDVAVLVSSELAKKNSIRTPNFTEGGCRFRRISYSSGDQRVFL
ncbi:hypothetical protein TNCV_1459601 [Trichonephila clavipes]|nr:hypothetical protein TNCV_1459601 [Trichonephila clavipes]